MRLPPRGLGGPGGLAAACRALALAAAAAVAALGLPAAAPAAAPPFQVHVTLEPPVVGLDEMATLSIEVEGGGLGSMHFQPNFDLDNLQVAGGASFFESVNVTNGALSRSFRYSLHLRPIAAGPARVRDIVLHLHGKVARLPDQELRVQEQPAGHASGTAGSAGGVGASGVPGAGRARPPDPEDFFDRLLGGSPFAQRPQARGPAAFLRAEVQPPRPLAGEQALYTIYLYTRQDVAAINATDMPTFHGFWVRDLPQPQRLTPEMVSVDGERYARVAMIRKALFALRPGPHTLEPAGCDVVIEEVARGFFGPSLAQPQELHLRTPQLAVNVEPLPPAPPGYAGLVGQMGLTTRLQPYSLHVGDGATLTVTLSGAGNLQGLAAPRLDLPPGLTVFSPQQRSEDRLDGLTVGGRRTWTYVVLANQPGIYRLQPHGILYFDPARREYELAQAPPLILAAQVPPPPPAGIAGRPGARSAAARSAAANTWWADGWREWAWPPSRWPRPLPWLLALPWGLLLMILLVRRHSTAATPAAPAIAGAANPAGAPGGLDALSQADLERQLRAAAREDRPRQAAALVEAGWRGFLAQRWGVPPATPPARWGAVLATRGVAPRLAEEIAGLTEEMHYLRYAPQLSTTAAVRDDLLSHSRALLRRLR